MEKAGKLKAVAPPKQVSGMTVTITDLALVKRLAELSDSSGENLDECASRVVRVGLTRLDALRRYAESKVNVRRS